MRTVRGAVAQSGTALIGETVKVKPPRLDWGVESSHGEKTVFARDKPIDRQRDRQRDRINIWKGYFHHGPPSFEHNVVT